MSVDEYVNHSNLENGFCTNCHKLFYYSAFKSSTSFNPTTKHQNSNMATHHVLVLNSTSQPLSLETHPIPTATPGSIVVKVLGSSVLPYLSSVLDGTLPYALTTPLVPGSSC